MCYSRFIKSASFLRLPAAALAIGDPDLVGIADSGPAGKEGAPRSMLARQVVLLTSSESSDPTQLLSRQQSTPGSPLAATLMSLPPSVANKRLTAWLSPLDSTLTKNRGAGVLWLTRHPTKSVCPERPSGVTDLSSLSVPRDPGHWAPITSYPPQPLSQIVHPHAPSLGL